MAPPPVNTIVENTNSGLENSGYGEIPHSSGVGGSCTPNNSNLQNLVIALQKQLKEYNEDSANTGSSTHIYIGRYRQIFKIVMKTKCNTIVDTKEI